MIIPNRTSRLLSLAVSTWREHLQHGENTRERLPLCILLRIRLAEAGVVHKHIALIFERLAVLSPADSVPTKKNPVKFRIINPMGSLVLNLRLLH